MPLLAEGLSAQLATDWRNAALRVGEELAADGPEGYYAFSPEQWVQWALSVLHARHKMGDPVPLKHLDWDAPPEAT